MFRLRDTSAMIFRGPCHAALTVYTVFPYGYEITEKVKLSVLCCVCCINTD